MYFFKTESLEMTKKKNLVTSALCDLFNGTDRMNSKTCTHTVEGIKYFQFKSATPKNIL